MKLIERITGKQVKIVRPGPNDRTAVIKFRDGSTQIQFRSLLKQVK
jgi:hypothetical protein